MKPDTKDPKPPSKKLRLEDARMRHQATHVVHEDTSVPSNLLWPYYQHELLALNNNVLEGDIYTKAMEIMVRDYGKAKKYRENFFW